MATIEVKREDRLIVRSVTLTLTLAEAQLIRDLIGDTPDYGPPVMDLWTALRKVPELEERKQYFNIERRPSGY
jgi:hypothetical protein